MSGQIILLGMSKSRLIVCRTTGRPLKTYLVKFSDHEEGPYAETQVAQMFADGRIDRNTACKPVSSGDWKTVDDYLPMVKYGTQLPPATKVPAVPPAPPPVLLFITTRVSGRFRYSVRVGSKDLVQMDGSSVRRLLLLPASHFCSLANCGGDIRRTI